VADVSYYPGDICDSRGNPSIGGGRVNHTLAHALVHTLISSLAWCPECGDDLLLLTRQGCGGWAGLHRQTLCRGGHCGFGVLTRRDCNYIVM